MKKNLAYLIVCIFLLTTSLSMSIHAEENILKTSEEFVTTNVDDILDQYNVDVSGDVLVDTATNWKYAQEFIPTFSILTRVEIYMYKSGNGGWRTYTASIKKTLDGDNLTNYTGICYGFPHEDSWIEFDFPDINVVPGETYYIVLTPGGCLWSHTYFFLLYYGQPDPYKRGDAWYLLESYQQYNPNDEHWEKFEPDGIPGDFCFKTYGINLPPNQPSKPNGKLNGKTGEIYNYTTSTNDPDGHDLYYFFDWGDGNNSGWLGPYISGNICKASHQWDLEGSYSIVVKAKDEYDESVWSDPLSITMPKNKAFNTYFLRFLEKLPNIFRLFQRFT
jgi:hypothetical protein